MEIIGILGGVASGKSSVARMFEQLGAIRLDADGAGHAVLELPEVKAALIGRWGERIVGANGQLDRGAIANLVFADRPDAVSELRFLEATTHPQIERLLRRQLVNAAAEGRAAAVLDAAVMLKAGWDRLCNRLIFVDVPQADRRRRALRRGWTAAEFEAREAAQWPLEEKRQRADTMIDNSGPLEETLDQVEALWSTWQGGRDEGERAP